MHCTVSQFLVLTYYTGVFAISPTDQELPEGYEYKGNITLECNLGIPKDFEYTPGKPIPIHPDAHILRYRKGNACIGGSLQVITKPNKLRLNRDNCNATFSKDEWKKEPDVHYSFAQMGGRYTLFMLDSSASDVEGAYHLHWLVVNIRAIDFRKSNFSFDDTLATYQGPFVNSSHTYEFLIYEQIQIPTQLPLLSPYVSLEQRKNFNLQEWLDAQSNTTFLDGPHTGLQFFTSSENKTVST